MRFNKPFFRAFPFVSVMSVLELFSCPPITQALDVPEA